MVNIDPDTFEASLQMYVSFIFCFRIHKLSAYVSMWLIF